MEQNRLGSGHHHCAVHLHRAGDVGGRTEGTRQTIRDHIDSAPVLSSIALYLPALVAWQHNPAIRVQCERLKASGKNGKFIVCAAMRKLIYPAFAILKSGKPFDPNFSLA